MAKSVKSVAPQKTSVALENTLRALEQEKRTVDARIVRRLPTISKLNKEQSSDEETRRSLEQQIAETTNRLFACTVPISKTFVAARNMHIARLQLLGSDHITVAKQRELKDETEAELSALQKMCAHPFVFEYDGYGGSHTNDYEDARYGSRSCTLCNLDENSQKTKEQVYSTLTEDGSRFIRRDLRNHGLPPLKWFEQEWFSLEFLRRLFECSAGGINIEWPPTVGKDAVFKFCSIATKD